VAARAGADRMTASVRVYLFGYLHDDFFGRVVVAPAERTVGDLARQLSAWAPARGRDRDAPSKVTNEAGEILDPALTIREAGLGNGDIFTVGPTT